MKKILCIFMCAVLLMLTCSCTLMGRFTYIDESKIHPDGQLIVHFIDVGQGDSILLESMGDFVLIDAGERDYSKTVCDYIKGCGTDTLDYVIATHPHSDHCGGLKKVLDTFTCENFITCETDQQTKTWLDILYAVSKNDVNYIDAVVSNTYSFGNATFEILGPYGTDYDNYNDYSVVLKATCGNTSFLFTGDAEKAVEKEMLEHNANLKADVLKVSHHGSSTSSSSAFLDAVNPTYAVISCGVGNEYGHPHKETVTNLDKRNVATFRTDVSGTIIATSDSQTIKFFDSELNALESIKIESDEISEYIGNKNSKKLHLSTCTSVDTMSEENKVYFDSKEDAINSGYTTCKQCNP